MAYFANNETAVVVNLLTFPAVNENTMQMFNCKNGERGAFKILNLVVDGVAFMVSQVFDYTTGAPVFLGTVSVIPEIDLTGGMFSSGCFCTGDPTAAGVSFFQVDYV